MSATDPKTHDDIVIITLDDVGHLEGEHRICSVPAGTRVLSVNLLSLKPTIVLAVPQGQPVEFEAKKRATQIAYPACRQCGSTRGLAPEGLSGDDEMIAIGSFQYVTRRAKDGVILCGSCDWPLDPQPESPLS